MAKYQLEVGARTVEDALSAWRGGADRVELYVSPMEGALTPSMGLVQAAVQAKKDTNIGLGLYGLPPETWGLSRRKRAFLPSFAN